MRNNKSFKREIFPCDCGEPSHAVVFSIDDDPTVFVSVSVVQHWRDHAFWQRIKMAWRILVRDEHILSEVVIDREHHGRLFEFFRCVSDETNGGE